MDPLFHVVLISFQESVQETSREEVYNRYQTLAVDCGGREAGIIFFKVEKNLDPRKGAHLVEIAVFRDNEALQQFRVHPKHKELTEILCRIADWQVGDITSPLPTPVPLQPKDLDLLHFDSRN